MSMPCTCMLWLWQSWCRAKEVCMALHAALGVLGGVDRLLGELQREQRLLGDPARRAPA